LIEAILPPIGRAGTAGFDLTDASCASSPFERETRLAGLAGIWGLGLSGITGGCRFSTGEVGLVDASIWGGCRFSGRAGIVGLDGTSGLVCFSSEGSIVVTNV
jgi:hypothetical protein